jgi:iron complex outermembrane receptor protein
LLVGVGANIRYFTNGLDTSTKGIDIVGTHSTKLLGARVNFTLAYNRNENEVTKSRSTVISNAQIITIENVAPKDRLNLSSNWSWGDWSVNARANYFGEWRNEQDYPGQVFGAKTTVDLDVSYTFAEKYTVTIGAQNLFSAYPDKIAQSSSINVFPISGGLADGQVYPRSGGPFGMNGGFGYVSLKANF